MFITYLKNMSFINMFIVLKTKRCSWSIKKSTHCVFYEYLPRIWKMFITYLNYVLKLIMYSHFMYEKINKKCSTHIRKTVMDKNLYSCHKVKMKERKNTGK